MANRSLWPEGVECHQKHLEFDTASRIDGIKRVVGDATSKGVVSGLDITPTSTYINIASGTGYAPNGEAMTLASSQTNVQLASYTAGAKNYVLLVYDETQSDPESHESNGTTRNTKATVSPRVSVLTDAAYSALPASDAVLSSNAKDRALVLAIVTANGPGVDLTSASIQGPTQFSTVLQASQPTNIVGVSIVNIDRTTSIGQGSLQYTAASKQLKWKAPTDSAFGAAVTLATSQTYTIASNNGRFIVVDVQYTLLSASDATDVVNVTNLYTQSIARLTNQDYHHRSMVGSGLPTTKNPHGLTVADLDPGLGGSVDQHQDTMHSNGIASDAASTLLSSSVTTAAAPDRLDVVDFTAGDAVYVNGRRIQQLITAANVTFSDGSVEPSLYGIYLSQNGALFKQVRATFPSTGTSLLYAKLQIVNVSSDIGSGTKTLQWTVANALCFDNGPLQSAPTSVDSIVRLYAYNRTSYIDVYVKNVAAPASNETDTITFTAAPSIDENLLLSYAAWSGSATGYVGYGFGTANAPNKVVDKRVFGNVASGDIRSDAGYNKSSNVVSETIGDGVAFRSDQRAGATFSPTEAFSVVGVSGLNVSIYGGVAYVGGKRQEVATTALVLANGTNIIYVDNAGVINSTTSTYATLDATNQPYIKLWEFVMSGGSETSRTDKRSFNSHKKDEAYGVPSLSANKAIVVASTAGEAIIATGYSGSSSFKSLGGDVEIPATNNFKYTTAITRYINLNAAGFNFVDAAAEGFSPILSRSPNLAWLSKGGTAAVGYELIAWVNLPPGATLVEAQVLGSNADSVSRDIQTTIEKHTYNSAGAYTVVSVASAQASTMTAGAALAWSAAFGTSTAADATGNSCFFIQVSVPNTTSDGQVRFGGLRMKYTRTTLG